MSSKDVKIKLSEINELNIIKPNHSLFTLNLAEIWTYRDLIRMFVKRDIVTFYKQTILGPLWFVVQPIIATILFVFVFSNLAGISTDGIPPILFYFSGIIIWNYFAECLTRNSKIFLENQAIFGKVYFPRLVVPISIIISNLIRFIIQLIIFIIMYLYYYFQPDSSINPNIYLTLFPLLVILIAGLSLGFGVLFSSLSTKYRDLTFLLQFGVQLWMYITPVIYPLSSMPQDKQWLMALNPMTSIVETFKYGTIGQGVFSWLYLAYSAGFMIVLLLFGIMIFNKVEKSFIDTV